MLHFTENYFFYSGTLGKNTNEPLQPLGFLPIITIHQMLHQCNIFKGNSHETPRETRRIRSRKNVTPSATFFHAENRRENATKSTRSLDSQTILESYPKYEKSYQLVTFQKIS